MQQAAAAAVAVVNLLLRNCDCVQWVLLNMLRVLCGQNKHW